MLRRYFPHHHKPMRLAAALVVTILAGCGNKQEAAAPPPPPQVGVIKLEAQPVTLTSKLPGRTSAYLVSEVRPQITGIIQKRLFREGAQVEADQVLYQIDPAPYQAALASAEAALQNALATRDSARLQARRNAKLVKVNAVSQQDNDNAQATYKQAEASVAVAQAAVRSARIDLNYTRITSPIAGEVSTSTYTPGALVTAHQDEALTTVRQLDPIYVDITESSRELLALKRKLASGQLRQAGDAKISVRLQLEDGSQYEHTGTLAFTGAAVDRNTGTVRLRAVFPNPDRLLLPGMYVLALVDQGVDRNGLLVPQQGITHNPRGEAVALVVSADNKVEQRTVTIVQALGNQWLVSDGLSAGDRLIIDGLQKVRPGATVTPVEAGGTVPQPTSSAHASTPASTPAGTAPGTPAAH